MKKPIGLNKISVRVARGDRGIEALLGEVAGDVKTMVVDPGLSAFVFGDNTVLEAYESGAVHPDYLFEGGDVVLTFNVKDLQSAMAALQKEEAILLGSVERWGNNAFCHMRLKSGITVGLHENGMVINDPPLR